MTITFLSVMPIRVNKSKLAIRETNHCFESTTVKVTLLNHCKKEMIFQITGTIQMFPHVLSLMSSTRKQKANGRKSNEIDILSEYGNMDVMLDGNSNSIGRELDNVINRPDGHQGFETLSNRGSSSHEIKKNEIKSTDNRNRPIRQGGLA